MDRNTHETTDSLESYDDRDGYDVDFLGSRGGGVPMPGLGDWENDEDLSYRLDHPDEYLLEYRHFSVAMARQRRLPLFSAVNIDGAREQAGVARTDIWKKDPRIPLEAQIVRECYGRQEQGFFSRGHMTRREDPNWGSEDEVVQADADTFHATNAAPQAQSFNSPIWLGLENYLMRKAHRDDMRLTVFTGPVLDDDDVEMFGVKIPSRFWKVAVFVHDDTARLTAVGYMASQATQMERLRRPQFVFGQYKDWQVPVSAVSATTGLDFSHLSRYDPLKAAGEAFALQLSALSDVYTQ